jgi:hypothetical protein
VDTLGGQERHLPLLRLFIPALPVGVYSDSGGADSSLLRCGDDPLYHLTLYCEVSDE